MTGKTHASIGVMSVLTVLQPITVKEAVFYIGVASIGSVICDIDVSKSDSRNKLNHVYIEILYFIIIHIYICNIYINK